jgi:hypothetical protein
MSQSIGQGIAGFEDNLYKKDFLIEKVALLRIKLGDRVFPVALLGKDGWMEYSAGSNIDDFQNVRSLGMGNKKKLVEKLTSINQYLTSQGITFLIVVAPNKASIYPDKLPEEINSLSSPSRLDLLIPYLESNNQPVILDLRTALRTARQNRDVYYKTDTHWNGYGAFVAYTTIIKSLGNAYPVLKPYEITDLELVTADPSVHDISSLMHANFITEPAFFFTPRESFVQTSHPGDINDYNQFSSISDSKLPTLLMFHDSFGLTNLNDYLSMNFEKSYFVHQLGMSPYFTKESIQKFDPDIVVIEIVERNLEQLVDYFSNFTPE